MGLCAVQTVNCAATPTAYTTTSDTRVLVYCAVDATTKGTEHRARIARMMRSEEGRKVHQHDWVGSEALQSWPDSKATRIRKYGVVVPASWLKPYIWSELFKPGISTETARLHDGWSS